jgi:hypothetical protein
MIVGVVQLAGRHVAERRRYWLAQGDDVGERELCQVVLLELNTDTGSTTRSGRTWQE